MTILTCISWNVNGYNDTVHTYMRQLLVTQPDVVFLNETKRKGEVLTAFLDEFTNYTVIMNVHVPSQMHGVVMLIRKDRKYEVIPINLGIMARSDTKDGNPVTGRLIALALEESILICGTYVPNSGIQGLNKLPYRINYWDPALFSILNYFKSHGPTLWFGDLNVAPTDFDLSHPHKMATWPGVSQQERTSFDTFMKTGWVDAWRSQHPKVPGYSWRGKSTSTKYGVRLDHVIITPNLLPYTTETFMLLDAPHSDHIPVGIRFSLP
jgi:exodeoxyribonuclease III